MLILLDRDGVLNENRSDYVKTPDELVLIKGSADAVSRLNHAGYQVALVTNQSAVGRRIISEEMLKQIHNKLREELGKRDAQIEKFFVCTDPPWAATHRRKPAPGMIQEALSYFSTQASESCMIGDSLRDLEAAATLGCQKILVRTGNGADTQARGLPDSILPVDIYENLLAAADGLIGRTL